MAIVSHVLYLFSCTSSLVLISFTFYVFFFSKFFTLHFMSFTFREASRCFLSCAHIFWTSCHFLLDPYQETLFANCIFSFLMLNVFSYYCGILFFSTCSQHVSSTNFYDILWCAYSVLPYVLHDNTGRSPDASLLCLHKLHIGVQHREISPCYVYFLLFSHNYH